MRRLVLSAAISLLLLTPASLVAQTPMWRSDLGIPSKIAPAYFGPNAFPVPEMPGVVSEPCLEVAAGWYGGTIAAGAQNQASAEDNTGDISIKFALPLFSDRVSLSVWGVVREFYSYGEAVAFKRRITVPGSGSRMGDIYVSTDILLLKESVKCPGVVLRAALKTASGGDFVKARYYDAPGYFFDAAVSKTLRFDGFISGLRISATTGFLCWQTDNARQNDAVQYGLSVCAESAFANLECSWGGYAGWEGDGDRPMMLRIRAEVLASDRFTPFILLRQGLSDYPFTGIHAGCTIGF